MTKFEALFKKSSLFEKITISKLGQDSSEIVDTTNQIRSTLKNLIEDLPQMLNAQTYINVHGLSNAFKSINYVRSIYAKDKYDLDTLPLLLSNLASIYSIKLEWDFGSDDAKNFWYKEILPKITLLIDMLRKQINNLQTWRDRNPTISKAL